MRRKVLLVEDNAYKREKVVAFLESLPFGFEVDQAYSFTTGSQKIFDGYSLVVLDVSLPTFDKYPSGSGGRFRPFGGRELARKIIRRGTNSNIVFITQYEAFSDKDTSLSLDELGAELRNECGGKFLGLIHYDSSKSAWKEEFVELLKRLYDENINC